MAAPKGNKFWEQRSKHGRDKLFDNPKLLWKAAVKYFQWCDDNPWYKVEYKGTPLKRVKIPTERPYTLEGFCSYVWASKNWWLEFKAADHKGFLETTTRIDEVIYQHKFEGAAVGAFNASIIARDLGLVDKKDPELVVKVDEVKIDYK